jgi:hypothetical protein
MTPEELNQGLVELIARHRRLLEYLAQVDPPEPDNEPEMNPTQNQRHARQPKSGNPSLR